MMSKRAARAAVDAIKTALGNIEKHVIGLIEGEGWKALGYETFVEMWSTEFSSQASRIRDSPRFSRPGASRCAGSGCSSKSVGFMPDPRS